MSLKKYLFMMMAWIMSCLAAAHQNIDLQVGDIHILKGQQIQKVVVGDGKIINALTDNPNEVLVFAKEKGKTSLQIWEQAGITHYQVQVKTVQEMSLQKELNNMIRTIKGVKLHVVGGKFILDGQVHSEMDKLKLRKLVAHYPQILDLTQDVNAQMISLDVVLLELPKQFMDRLGIEWEHSVSGNLLSGVLWNILPTIKAMKSDTGGIILAEPQLMTRSGTEAEFLAGGELPYSMTDAQGRIHTSFKSYGINLKITPELLPQDRVRSQVVLEMSALDSSLNLNGGPALKTHRVRTEFSTLLNHTIVLAGFISKEQVKGLERVPGMSDIPILGALFHSEKFQNNETELVILVTPRLVDSEQGQQAKSQIQKLVQKHFSDPSLLTSQATQASAYKKAMKDSQAQVVPTESKTQKLGKLSEVSKPILSQNVQSLGSQKSPQLPVKPSTNKRVKTMRQDSYLPQSSKSIALNREIELPAGHTVARSERAIDAKQRAKVRNQKRHQRGVRYE